MGRDRQEPTRMKAVELRLNEKQKFLVLLYMAKRIPVAKLLAALEGCEEMSLLRLEERNAD